MKELILKLKIEIVALITMFLTFVSPIYGLFYIVGSAVMLDTFFGIYKTIKLGSYKDIQSHKLFNVAVKTFFYLGSIILGFGISVYVTDSSLFGINFFIPKFLCVLWTSIECKSMDETNIELGNKSVIEHIKAIIKGLKSFKKDINDLKN